MLLRLLVSSAADETRDVGRDLGLLRDVAVRRAALAGFDARSGGAYNR